MILKNELSIGNRYSQEEIESAFDTNFGYRIKGINPRIYEGNKKYIILFYKESGPYQDEISASTEDFFYIGEGQEGDQAKTSGNKALIDSIENYVPIFFFISSEPGSWEYQGLVSVKDYQYINNGERKVFRFKMEKLNISSNSEYEETEEN